MDSVEKTQDQQHPQYKRDRASVNTLLASEATDYNLSELARLIIRYRGFPGARDIQSDLKKVLKNGIIRKKVFTKKPVKFTPPVKFTGNKKALKKRIGFKLKSTLNTSFISYVRKAILRQLRSELAIEINE